MREEVVRNTTADPTDLEGVQSLVWVRVGSTIPNYN